MRKYDVIHKPEVHSILLRRQTKSEPRPQLTCTKKFGEDRTYSSEYMIAVIHHTHRHTDRQTDRQTRSSQYSAPYRGRINNRLFSLWRLYDLDFGLPRKQLLQNINSVTFRTHTLVHRQPKASVDARWWGGNGDNHIITWKLKITRLWSSPKNKAAYFRRSSNRRCWRGRGWRWRSGVEVLGRPAPSPGSCDTGRSELRSLAAPTPNLYIKQCHCVICTYGDSGVISMPAGFRRHLVGKTLINVYTVISLK